MAIFAAEVAALVLSFIYQGRVSYISVAMFTTNSELYQNHHVKSALEHLYSIFTLYLSVQINGDLEHSMNDTFAKYNGEDPETNAVDFLQTQAGVIAYKSFSFSSTLSAWLVVS